MTVAVPFATAVTRPAAETVATDEADVVHAAAAPEITSPSASFTVTLTVAVLPSAAKLSEVGDSSTLEAGFVIVTNAVALTEPDVAVIVAVPFATEVTSPVDETVATDVFDDVHVTTAPDTVLPPESFTVAVNVAVAPIPPRATEPGDTSTVDAT